LVPIAMGRAGATAIKRASDNNSKPDPSLIKALRKARSMIARDDMGMPVIEAAPASPYLRKLVRMAFLAAELQRDILAGRQPPDLSLEKLIRMDIPHGWAEQRRILGWPIGL